MRTGVGRGPQDGCAVVDPAIATRRLGRTPLRLSEIGFGAAGIGNLYAAVGDAQAAQALDAAWEAGLRYVDTAPYYGFGLSERRVGDAVRRHRGADGWVVSTKVGRLLRPCRDAGAGTRNGFADALPFEPHFDYSHDGILRSFEDSLQRMGRERVDILLVHDIGPATHGADDARHDAAFWDGGYRALERLRADGRIAAIGLGVNEWQVCERYMARADFDCFLLAGRYTLLEQGALESFLPACAARGVGVILGGIFNSGILATGVTGGVAGCYDYAPPAPGVVERVARLQRACEAHGVRLAAAALQFALAHPQVASVIPGVSDAGQLEQCLRDYRSPIPAALWDELRGQGLIAPGAPVPAEPTA